MLAALGALVALPAIAAAGSRPVYIATYIHPEQRPKVVALWASGGLGKLKWSHWGKYNTHAYGQEAVDNGGTWTDYRAEVAASRPRECHGRRMYTRLHYRSTASGWHHWFHAGFSDCRFYAK